MVRKTTSSSRAARARSSEWGFTLLELLAVVVIIGILFTLGSKAIRAVRLSARTTQARVEMASIETAVKAYFNKYGKLPVADALQGQGDLLFDEDGSREVVRTLSGQETGINPAKMVFLEIPHVPADGSEAAFNDPWGKPYLVALDTDYDGELAVDGGVVLRRKVAVKSEGLWELRGMSGTNDILKSWE